MIVNRVNLTLYNEGSCLTYIYFGITHYSLSSSPTFSNYEKFPAVQIGANQNSILIFVDQ